MKRQSRRLPCRAAVALAATALFGIGQPGGAEEGETIVLPPREQFHLFLLIGQSNMAGRGKVEAVDREVHPRVLTLSKEGQWAPAVDPIHFDKPGMAGVCLGRTFGIEVAKREPTITVGLIPCAAGGSPVTAWEPGQHWKQTNSFPYDDALRRTKLALQSGVLKGILWHQGESDSKPGAAEEYEARLAALIARLRTDLDAPEAPFLIGQLGQFPGRPWNEFRVRVDAAHRRLAETVPHVAFVPSDGLTDRGDNTHFDAASLREFGRRYAAAYATLCGLAPAPTAQPAE